VDVSPVRARGRVDRCRPTVRVFRRVGNWERIGVGIDVRGRLVSRRRRCRCHRYRSRSRAFVCVVVSIDVDAWFGSASRAREANRANRADSNRMNATLSVSSHIIIRTALVCVCVVSLHRAGGAVRSVLS